MTHTDLQLQRDLDNSIDDGALLARQVLGSAISFLREGQNYSPSDVFALVEDILTESTCDYYLTMTQSDVANSRWLN